MMKTFSKFSRLWILALFLFAGFSAVWMLPDQGLMRPSLLSEALPSQIEKWTGTSQKVGQKELDILAKDTVFERKNYQNSTLPNHPGVEVSIVFSGKDMNNSIHRPEVCLRAQGWNFIQEKYITIDTEVDALGKIPFKVILCERPLFEGKDPRLDKNGNQVVIRRIQYYTFFGHSSIVAGHFERVWEDMKDRIFKGYDQRWAYATFSSVVTQKFIDDGVWSSGQEAYDDEQTSDLIEKVIKSLMSIGIERRNLN